MCDEKRGVRTLGQFPTPSKGHGFIIAYSEERNSHPLINPSYLY